jgi:type IV pilus assembly protein PilM
MSREDLAGAIKYQAQDAIPIPLDEAVMDYEVIDEVDGPEEGEKLQRVLVVAAERGTVQNLLSAVQLAKLDIATLELDAYPLVRCFRSSDPQKAEAIVDIGAGVTNVVVHQGGKIRFTRILPTFGGDDFTVAVAQALDIAHDDAEVIKRQASALLRDRATHAVAPVQVAATSRAPQRPVAREAVVGGTDMPGGSYQSYSVASDADSESDGSDASTMSSGTPVERAAEIMEPILDRFVAEIRGSLDFYGSQPDALPIERVVMTGGGSLMGGIVEQLEATLGLPVDLGHPLEQVPIGKIQVSPEERAIAEPFIAVSVGLALAGTGA